MLLTVLDRLALLQILPREGTLLDLRAVHQLRMSLAPSDDEAAAIQAAVDPAGFLDESSETAHRTTEILVSPRAHTVVQDLLKDLEAKKKLPEACLGLWDLFLPAESP
jgi:hypothetical protein